MQWSQGTAMVRPPLSPPSPARAAIQRGAKAARGCGGGRAAQVCLPRFEGECGHDDGGLHGNLHGMGPARGICYGRWTGESTHSDGPSLPSSALFFMRSLLLPERKSIAPPHARSP